MWDRLASKERSGHLLGCKELDAKAGSGVMARAGRYILAETLCRNSLRTRYAWFLGRAAFLSALEESLRNMHNQMDPRCSLEPAYEEDAATD